MMDGRKKNEAARLVGAVAERVTEGLERIAEQLSSLNGKQFKGKAAKVGSEGLLVVFGEKDGMCITPYYNKVWLVCDTLPDDSGDVESGAERILSDVRDRFALEWYEEREIKDAREPMAAFSLNELLAELHAVIRRVNMVQTERQNLPENDQYVLERYRVGLSPYDERCFEVFIYSVAPVRTRPQTVYGVEFQEIVYSHTYDLKPFMAERHPDDVIRKVVEDVIFFFRERSGITLQRDEEMSEPLNEFFRGDKKAGKR